MSIEPPHRDDPVPWQDSIYDALHRIASRALAAERPGHSLQPTLLVNDAYMKLLDQQNVSPGDRSQVLAAGATIIRRLLVDYARKRKAQKRGGAEARRIPLSGEIMDPAITIDILELHDALKKLDEVDPRAATVVELRYFGGLSNEEIGEQLGVSIGTVKNTWRHAKAWLYRAMN